MLSKFHWSAIVLRVCLGVVVLNGDALGILNCLSIDTRIATGVCNIYLDFSQRFAITVVVVGCHASCVVGSCIVIVRVPAG